MKTAVKKAPKPAALPTIIGTPFAGGFYAGRFYDAGKPYLLILAPKAAGEKKSTPWGTTDKLVKGALSYSNGPTNTAAMAKAGSGLAKWVRGLKIGGHKDWYLPSHLESLVIFGELRTLKAFESEKPDGIARLWYWTSTQYAGDAGSAWFQGFGDGLQHGYRKGTSLRARAVRRLAI